MRAPTAVLLLIVSSLSAAGRERPVPALAFHFLEDRALTANEVQSATPGSLSLAPEPFLTDAHLTGYDPLTHVLYLTPEGAARLKRAAPAPSVPGTPFAAVCRGIPVWIGAFYSGCSSLSFPGPVLSLEDIPAVDTLRKIPLAGGYPGRITGYPDRRSHPEFQEVLRGASLLRTSLRGSLRSARFSSPGRREDIPTLNLECTILLENLDSEDIRIPSEEVLERFMVPVIRVDGTLLERPYLPKTRWRMLESDDFPVLRAGGGPSRVAREQRTVTVRFEGYGADLPPGLDLERDCRIVLRVSPMVVQANPGLLERTGTADPSAIWIGEIELGPAEGRAE